MVRLWLTPGGKNKTAKTEMTEPRAPKIQRTLTLCKDDNPRGRTFGALGQGIPNSDTEWNKSSGHVHDHECIRSYTVEETQRRWEDSPTIPVHYIRVPGRNCGASVHRSLRYGEDMDNGSEPVSWRRSQVRGNDTCYQNHICRGRSTIPLERVVAQANEDPPW